MNQFSTPSKEPYGPREGTTAPVRETECFAHLRAPTCRYPEASLLARQDTLKAIINRENRGIIIVTGSSGSGKDTLAQKLFEQGLATPVMRFSTRQPRVREPNWHQVLEPAEFKRPGFVLSYSKGGNIYGYHREQILSAASDGTPALVIIGDPGKVQPFISGLARELPLIPHTVVHLEVATEELIARLRQRETTIPGESEARIAQNALLRVTSYISHNINAPLQSALVLVDPDFLGSSVKATVAGKKLEGDELMRCILGDLDRSHQRSIEAATSMLEPATLPNNHWALPKEVYLGLQKLARACDTSQQEVLLKGGTAVALYLLAVTAETNRPDFEIHDKRRTPLQLLAPAFAAGKAVRKTSLDIDFTTVPAPATLPSAKDFELPVELLRSLSTSSDSVTLATNLAKPVFKSTKASTEMRVGSGNVDLDFIAVSRVKHDDSPFAFTFVPSPLVDFTRRPVIVGDGGEQLCLLPPEPLALEKFLAGRGEALGKYDLWDATSLVCTQVMRTALISDFFTSQHYSSEFDDLLTLPQPSEVLKTPALLSDFGITDQRLQRTIIERLDPKNSGFEIIGFDWSLDTIKQIAAIDRTVEGVDAALSEAKTKRDLGEGRTVSAVEIFSRDLIRTKLTALREFLYHLAELHIGRTDVL